ncbi:DUF4247 domain-containing protein [Cytobacillus sp. Sa5YUA1]|uniref:DUF4247 domain-containing protein n=1 Tax=Cytobacillus stercorigallinarum TaxID=2762240 RepID=A0ABR8QSC8_9BACI|nr:DUF4247 domain-containing protein [Cytobacillus stercorigallinarum]MBD7938309.1 DUF4247 domain-containing protein [Cytobacillus stercorigallinarum]
MKKSLFFVLISFTLMLTACGSGTQTSGSTTFNHGIAAFINDHYTFYDVISSQDNTSDLSEIYIAEDQTIDQVVVELKGYQEPTNISEKHDMKQVLVYDDLFVIVTEDENDTNNSAIEVASQGFVRDNYQPSFFNGLFAVWMLNNLFGSDNWVNKRQNECQYREDCYGGYYASGGYYKNSDNTRSIRSSTVRGGGPGSGK